MRKNNFNKWVIKNSFNRCNIENNEFIFRSILFKL